MGGEGGGRGGGGGGRRDLSGNEGEIRGEEGWCFGEEHGMSFIMCLESVEGKGNVVALRLHEFAS